MRKAYQYSYINDTNKHPDDLTLNKLITGGIFYEKTPIYQLGIQALPGTKFYLNGGLDPIIIGATGIYELDLQEKAVISALQFDPESIRVIHNAQANGQGGPLIVDIIYEGEED